MDVLVGCIRWEHGDYDHHDHAYDYSMSHQPSYERDLKRLCRNGNLKTAARILEDMVQGKTLMYQVR